MALPIACSPGTRQPTIHWTCQQKLAAGGGLVLSGAIDGVCRGLEDLVRMSTTPDVGQRLKTATEFLEYLALAEADERPAQPVETTVDRSVAQKGERLDAGLIVDRRLGQGSLRMPFWSIV